jgi:molecular chaperone IbpA
MSNTVTLYSTNSAAAKGAATTDMFYIPDALEAWSVGFDRQFGLFRQLELDKIFDPKSRSYPPYNILRDPDDEDAYIIELAVAGFERSQLNVEVKESILTISTKNLPEYDDASTYIHKGIARRNFTRKFALAEHMIVKEAELENGILYIYLLRELPEEKRARTIDISTGLS